MGVNFCASIETQFAMCNPKAADGGVLGLARVHLDQVKESLQDLAGITKIKATQLAKTSQKAVYSLLSTLLTATLVISASLFLYGTFYYAYMPKEVHESAVNFEFTPCEDPPAMCSFPKATIDTRRQKLMTGQPYSINMLLEVPDSPNNHAMGMFMSCINMRTAEGKTIREVCKSNILEYRSPLLPVVADQHEHAAPVDQYQLLQGVHGRSSQPGHTHRPRNQIPPRSRLLCDPASTRGVHRSSRHHVPPPLVIHPHGSLLQHLHPQRHHPHLLGKVHRS